MRAAVIVFPGSNCDRDACMALRLAAEVEPILHWHGDPELPVVDLIVLPGGFSHGDYLRAGAMAAHSPVMREVRTRAAAGVAVLGICNGFQVLVECGLLPGALVRNNVLRFVSREAVLGVQTNNTIFTRSYSPGTLVRLPIAHNEGNYQADEAVLDRLEGEDRVVFRYCEDDNPNGSARNIAGILNSGRNVLGMMPHPERAVDPLLGGTDGVGVFRSMAEGLPEGGRA